MLYNTSVSDGMPVYFSFGTPLGARHFFNREQEVKIILHRTGSIAHGVRNDIALIGPRRIGKSSLLNFLQEKLEQKGFIVLRVDCEGLDLESFLKELGNQAIAVSLRDKKLSEKFLSQIQKNVMEGITALAELLGRISAFELKKTKELVSVRLEIEKSSLQKQITGEELDGLFRKTLQLPDSLPKKCIIMLDEFQETAFFKLNGRSFFANFRNITQNQKNTAFIFTGSSTGMMREIFGNPQNPLAGNAEIISIEPFNPETAMNFLKKGFHTVAIKTGPEVINFITQKTGGFPSYLNWMGLRISERGKKKITLTDADEAFNKMLSPESPVYQMIEKQLSKLGKKTVKLLKTIAAGTTAPVDMAKNTGIRNVYVYLNRLQKYGIIEKQGNAHKLVDCAMEEYLKK